MRPFIPTKRLWLLLGCGVVLALLGALIPDLERFVLPFDIAVILVYWLTGRLASKWTVIKVARRFDPVLAVRQSNLVTLQIEFLSKVVSSVHIFDTQPEAFEVEGNEFDVVRGMSSESEHRYWMTPRERGTHEFGQTYIRFTAPFGLAMVQQTLETAEEVRVYPNVKAVREFDLLNQRGKLREVGVRQTRTKGLGTEFESLREYNDDDFRRIDWKSSARRGRLVVKDFEQERNQAVIVCLDCGRHMLGEVSGTSKLDHALDAVLMVLHAAERAGDMVGAYAFNDVVRAYVAPKRGRAQLAAILGATHALYADPVEPDYTRAFNYLSSKWKKRSLVIVFTEAQNEDEATRLASALSHIRKRHLLMVVRVKDPRMNELLEMPVTNESDLYLNAAAIWSQTDRNKATSVLAASGIHSIEAEPEELASALVNAYWRVKQLSLI